jgi:hypothetical protein
MRFTLVALVLLTLVLIAESQMKANHWQQQYGASRRKIDHAILAAAERAIPDGPPKAVAAPDPDRLAANIAQQIQFEHDKRQRMKESNQAHLHAVARAFGRPVK